MKWLFFLITLSAFADEAPIIPVLTIGERHYTNAQIAHPTPSGAMIFFDGGMTSIKWSNAPAAFQQQYHYTPEAAREYENQLVVKRKEQSDADYAKELERAAQQRIIDQINRQKVWDYWADMALNPASSIYGETLKDNSTRHKVMVELQVAGKYYEELSKSGATNFTAPFEKMKTALYTLYQWQKSWDEIQEKLREKEEQRRVAGQQQRTLEAINRGIAQQNAQLRDIQDAQEKQARALDDLKQKQAQAESDRQFKEIQDRFRTTSP